MDDFLEDVAAQVDQAYNDLYPEQEVTGVGIARELALALLRYADLLVEHDPGLAARLQEALGGRPFL